MTLMTKSSLVEIWLHKAKPLYELCLKIQIGQVEYTRLHLMTDSWANQWMPSTL